MNIRKQLCIWLFDLSKLPYARFFKNRRDPWPYTRNDLLQYHPLSLGFAVGTFLHNHNFEMIPKLERHDAYHVITGIGTSVEEEIALQFFFMGNGKHSLYLYGVVLIGLLMVPEHYFSYFSAFYRGKYAAPLHELQIEDLLSHDLRSIQNKIFSTYPQPLSKLS